MDSEDGDDYGIESRRNLASEQSVILGIPRKFMVQRREETLRSFSSRNLLINNPALRMMGSLDCI